jgi:hypothetical protein
MNRDEGINTMKKVSLLFKGYHKKLNRDPDEIGEVDHSYLLKLLCQDHPLDHTFTVIVQT